jgi:hypothetical protein
MDPKQASQNKLNIELPLMKFLDQRARFTLSSKIKK